MAISFSSGGQSAASHYRTVERVLEDAQHTGVIHLCGRNLREYPKISSKYELSDTSFADLSKNRLNDVPQEICEYHSLERLNCYHNMIKSLPEALTQLHNLTHLCISRNQLTVIPAFIKQLQALEVLIASHNKLVSLPEEIGDLKRLMEIDCSCNEISHLPVQIGDLKSLRSLNVRRNLLIELPIEMSKLNLRKLDFSSNKVPTIPTLFRKMETLEEIMLEDNPLTLPPAFVCSKGKHHIMKYLQMEAMKEDRKRGILNETDMKRLVRKSLPPQTSISDEFHNMMMENTSQENKWNKRHTVMSSDSGYSTTDSIEKCGFSPSEAGTVTGYLDDGIRAAMSGDQHMYIRRTSGKESEYRPPLLNTAYTDDTDHHTVNPLTPKTPTPHQYQIYGESLVQDGMQMIKFQRQDSCQEEINHMSPSSSPLSPQTPVTPNFFISESHGMNEDDFTRELKRQKNEYEQKKKHAEQLRLRQEEEEKENCFQASQKIQDDQQESKLKEEARLQEEKMQEEQRQMDEAYKREEPQVKEDERKKEQARLAEEQKQLKVTKRQVESNCQYYSNHPQDWQSADRYSVTSQLNHVMANSSYSQPSPGTRDRAPSQGEYSTSMHGYSHVQGCPCRIPEDFPGQEVYSCEVNKYVPKQNISVSAQGAINKSFKSYSSGMPGYSRVHKVCPSSSQGYDHENGVYSSGVQSDSPEYSTGSVHSPDIFNPSSPGVSPSVSSHQPSAPNQRTGSYQPKCNHMLFPNKRNMVDTYSMQYRNPGPSPKSPTKEDKKPPSNGQSRRTVSNNSKKDPSANAATSCTTPAKHGAINGKSPTPSPRSSLGSTCSSPSTSTSSLHKIGSAYSGGTRRTKVTERVTSVQTTSTQKTLAESERHGWARTNSSLWSDHPSARSSTSSSTSSATKKNNITPRPGSEEEKKKPLTSASRTTNYNSRRSGTVMSSTTMKVIDSYKDANPNYTLQRQEERYRDNAEQIDNLRKTIESRLKVVLPDNMPEILRDGVLLCQLANNVRPRAVTSIHVPSQAVPKLTMAKCRKNVENFLEACKKMGVGREQICSAQDILEEKGISRIAVTIAKLVAITSDPKGSAV